MSGPLPFPPAQVPGWGWVGIAGDKVFSALPPGIWRQLLQLGWIAAWMALAFLALWMTLRQMPRLNRPLAWAGIHVCHLFERLLMWIDFWVVTACRSAGLTPLYWPSEAIERAASLGDVLIVRAARSGTTFAGRWAGRIAPVLAVACLASWDFSVCVTGAGPGCVHPHAGWWLYTRPLFSDIWT